MAPEKPLPYIQARLVLQFTRAWSSFARFPPEALDATSDAKDVRINGRSQEAKYYDDEL